MKHLSKVLMLFFLSLHLTGFAQEKDLPGSKDIPGISRYGDAVIAAYKELSSRAYYYCIGPDMRTPADIGAYNTGDGSDLYECSGSTTFLGYYQKKALMNPTITHYKKQIEGLGYELYYECQNTAEYDDVVDNCGASIMANLYAGQNPYNNKDRKAIKGDYTLYNYPCYYACYIKGNTIINLAISRSSENGFVYAVLDRVQAEGEVVTKQEDYALEFLGMQQYKNTLRQDAYNKKVKDYICVTAEGVKKVSDNLVSTVYVNKSSTNNSGAIFSSYEKTLLEDLDFEKNYACSNCQNLVFDYYKFENTNADNLPNDSYMYRFGDHARHYGFYQKDGQSVVILSYWNAEVQQTHTMIDVLGGTAATGNTVSNNDDETVDQEIIEAYVGKWSSSWGDMEIKFEEGRLTGTYTHDEGRLEGELVNGVFTGTWKEAPTYSFPDDGGEVKLILSADKKSFTGKWRYGTDGDWNEDWTGSKTRMVPKND